MSEDTRTLVAQAVRGLLDEVPALKPLKLVVAVELHGRRDVQELRLQLPEVSVTKELPTDAKVRVELRRDEFNRLAERNRVADWRDALATGRVKVSGVQQYLQLIAQVVERHEERARTKKARR